MTQTFDAWLAEVDAQVWALAGCSVRDLPDCLFADWYADGMSSRTAARRAIRNADNDEDVRGRVTMTVRCVTLRVP
jgi:hypothetical protein